MSQIKMEVENSPSRTIKLIMIVTNGMQRGEECTFDYDEDTTFGELQQFLVNKFGENDIRLFLDEFGRQSLCEHAIGPIKSKKLRHSIMPSWSIPLSVTEFGEEIPIRIVDSQNRVKLERIHETDCVDVLKAIVEEWLKIEPREQLLTFPPHAGDVRDCDTLQSLGVRSYSQVVVGVPVRGAGVGPSEGCFMVDVSKKNAMQDMAFGPRGETWEKLSKGFCVSAKCMNSECNAFGKTVYCNMGFGVMDLTNLEAVCPACQQDINGEGMGFNNCFYSIRGVKEGSRKEFKVNWTRVDNFYRTWDSKTAGVVKWSMLEVITRSLNRRFRGGTKVKSEMAMAVNVPVATNCAICFQSMYALQLVKLCACGHSFHVDCWDAWDSSQKRSWRPTRCPLCRKVI